MKANSGKKNQEVQRVVDMAEFTCGNPLSAPTASLMGESKG
jgi:hypothetical protein